MQPEMVTTVPASRGLADWLRQLAYRLHLPTTMIKFLIVGGIGFVINQAVLFLLYDTGIAWFLPAKGTPGEILFLHPSDMRLLLSSIIAVEVAIVAQFNFHDRWTFRHRRREGSLISRFARFNLSSAVSPIIVVLTVNLLTPVLRDGPDDSSLVGTLAPYIATTVGVLLGFIWNWTLNSVVIWPTHRASRSDN
jgi:putative flippase GtrA